MLVIYGASVEVVNKWKNIFGKAHCSRFCIRNSTKTKGRTCPVLQIYTLNSYSHARFWWQAGSWGGKLASVIKWCYYLGARW